MAGEPVVINISDADSVSFTESVDTIQTAVAQNDWALRSTHYKMHHPRWQSYAFPVGIGLVSSFFATNGWCCERRNELQDWLDTHHKTKSIDNYVQYTPIIALYGLDICGVKAKHSIVDRTGVLAIAALFEAVMVNSIKYTVKEPRPDGSSHNSFPSGHTATAFMGAEILFQEYRDISPWIGYSGYLMAAATGALRIYNNRHWMNDIVAGACVGVISTKLSYWLYPIIFSRDCSKRRHSAMILPVIEDGGGALCLSLQL